jgi:hypothetical protein
VDKLAQIVLPAERTLPPPAAASKKPAEMVRKREQKLPRHDRAEQGAVRELGYVYGEALL